MKTLILFTVLQLGAAGNDAYWTDKNLHQFSYREHDPVAAPFVKNRVGVVAYFSVTTAIKIAVPLELRKHHGKIARVFQIWGIGDSAYGGIVSERRSHGRSE